jgi:hypothetical protein
MWTIIRNFYVIPSHAGLYSTRYSSCSSQQGMHSRQYSFDLCGGDSCSVVCMLALCVYSAT